VYKRQALGLAFWMMARMILLELGKISSEDEFPYTLEDFTSKIVPVYRPEGQGQTRGRQGQTRGRQGQSRGRSY